MDKFESTQCLTRNRLVALALLIGCDYLQGGVSRVGIVTAREIISEFSINDDDHALTILDRFGSYFRGEIPIRASDSNIKKKLRKSKIVLPEGFPNSDIFIEATSIYLCPEVKEKKELPAVPQRNLAKVESILMRECGWTSKRFSQEVGRSRRRSQKIESMQSHKLTEFFPTVRRSISTRAVSCEVFAQNHSRREWAALQRLRANARLYDKTEVTIDDAKACAKPNGVRRRPPKRRLAEGSVSCPSSKCKRLENSPNSDMAMLALPGTAGLSADQDEQVLVDALPYLDTEYNDADRQTALRLIDQECKIFRPTKNYLKHLPVPDFDVFLTPCMLKEQARMSKKQEMPKLDMSRCELPCPSGTSRAGDKVQWRKAIKNAKAQNEHLVMRQINLELMEEYAAETYLRRNKELEQLCTEAERELRRTKEQVMEIHARRKMAQLEAGRQLRELEGSWVAMVTNNYRMELANNQLAAENAQMAKRLRLDPAAIDKLN
ncbi:breast carcinoma amplified sequence 2 [Ostertagia ostertagi]